MSLNRHPDNLVIQYILLYIYYWYDEFKRFNNVKGDVDQSETQSSF